MTKIRKFFKWLLGLFSTTTVVSMGKGNSTFVSQTTKVTTMSSKEFTETLNEALRQVRQNSERRLKMSSPTPPSPPERRVVVEDGGYRRSNGDAVLINTTTISDTYTYHTPSHSSSSHDSYSSCDSSSSFSGSCD